MSRLEDPMMRAVREADPGTAPEVVGWADTAEATAIAERIRIEGDRDAPVRQPKRRRPSRRLVVVIALVAVVGSAVAASIALRPRTPVSSSLVACYPDLSAGSGPVLVAARDTEPVDACARAWVGAFSTAKPSRLTACVRPEGGLAVYPVPPGETGAGACAQVGAAAYSNDDASG
jgi:hypothetical protein